MNSYREILRMVGLGLLAVGAACLVGCEPAAEDGSYVEDEDSYSGGSYTWSSDYETGGEVVDLAVGIILAIAESALDDESMEPERIHHILTVSAPMGHGPASFMLDQGYRSWSCTIAAGSYTNCVVAEGDLICNIRFGDGTSGEDVVIVSELRSLVLNPASGQ